MFKKKECYLCGGKLINGRCSSCGLDNTKLDKKNYRLNESSFDRKKKMTYSRNDRMTLERQKTGRKRRMRDISVRVITDGKERRQNISKKKIRGLKSHRQGRCSQVGRRYLIRQGRLIQDLMRNRKRQGKSVEFLRELSWQSYHLQALQDQLVISFPHLGMISIPQIMTGMMMAAKWSLSMIHI